MREPFLSVAGTLVGTLVWPRAKRLLPRVGRCIPRTPGLHGTVLPGTVREAR
jgi:hypothetical protein